jgi:hypothetical protein
MPATTILIVAQRSDVHAQALAALAARYDVRAPVFDAAEFPATAQAALRFGGDPTGLRVRSADLELCFDELRSVWWRRPSAPRIAEEVEDDHARRFCLAESEALLRGALDASRVPVINHPAAQARAARKPLQLATARSVGLAVPETVMSNDPEEIRRFCGTMSGRCIYKTFTAPSQRLATTRLLTEEVLADLETLRHAPIIAQEMIDGRDLRVTVIGDRVFAAAAHGRRTSACVDGRLDRTTTWRPCDLPEQTRNGLVALTRRLGLDYGCIDLREQPDGRQFFLEINPAGQFLFVEIDTGQPLLQSLLELLLEPRRPRELTLNPSE